MSINDYKDRIPLKMVNVIVGFDPKSGQPMGITHHSHDNKRIMALGLPVEVVMIQSKNIVSGEVVVTEINLDKALLVEYTPAAIVEPAPPVEGGAVSPEVPEVSVV
jgi:hypothetical protein